MVSGSRVESREPRGLAVFRWRRVSGAITVHTDGLLDSSLWTAAARLDPDTSETARRSRCAVLELLNTET